MGSGSGKAIVRKAVEQLEGVSRTWFEWRSDGDLLGTVLVVEIEGDTDPEGVMYDPSVIRAIDQEVAHVLQNRTTMIIRSLRIIPKDR